MKKKIYLILSITLLSLIITYVDAIIKPNYFTKIPFKIIAFLLIPILYFIVNKEEQPELKKLFKYKKQDIIKGIKIGLPIYILMLISYFMTKNIINFSNVAPNLSKTMGITKDNYYLVALYIPLLNSFQEEFFFRGYGFIQLKKKTSRIFAYIFTSLMFSIYHIGMLIGSFDLIIIILLLIALIIGGCIFNYLNEKNDNIFNSWMCHLFIDLSISTIGLIIFGII
jgi:membrane protease YdiL (CAAX protease family)